MLDRMARDSIAPPTNIASAKLKLDELFLTWVSSTNSIAYVEELVVSSASLSTQDVDDGVPMDSTADGVRSSSPPKKASQKTSQSPKRSYNRNYRGLRRSNSSSSNIMDRLDDSMEEDEFSERSGIKPRYEIPRFYFPSGSPGQSAVDDTGLAKLRKAFEGRVDLSKEDLITVLESVGSIPPSICRLLLIQSGLETRIKEEAAVRMWRANIAGRDPSSVLFDALRQPYATSLTTTDFRVLIRVILDHHPGLGFLQNTAEFQERYLETVIVRIFYNARRGNTGRMTLNEVRRCGLISTIAAVDAEPDINRSADVFSYEHFYVIYCKFWELDKDHDLIIDSDDLSRYGGGALTRRAVERIASVQVLPRDLDLARLVAARAKKKPTRGVPAKFMTYQDFVWFILSEEDKNTHAAIDYWFRVIDVDYDGYWSVFELEFFFNSSAPRLQAMGMELPPFEDMLCQWLDMLAPQAEGRVSLRDVHTCKLAPAVVNALVNPSKCIAMETKDPFMVDPDAGSDWVKFAQTEYELAVAEHEVVED